MALTVRGQNTTVNHVSNYSDTGSSGDLENSFTQEGAATTIAAINDKIVKPTVVENDFMICYAVYADGGTYLYPGNPNYEPNHQSGIKFIDYWNHLGTDWSSYGNYTPSYNSTDLRPLDVNGDDPVSGTSPWELWFVTPPHRYGEDLPIIVAWVKIANSVDASNSVTHIKIPKGVQQFNTATSSSYWIRFVGYSPYASVMSIDIDGASLIATKHSFHTYYTPAPSSNYNINAPISETSSVSVPSITSNLPSGSMHIGIVGGEYYGDYWPEGQSGNSNWWPASVVPSGHTLASRGVLGLSYYKTLSSAGEVSSNSITLNSATDRFQAVSIALQPMDSGTFNTVRRRLFQENGSLYPSGTVVYAHDFENPLSLISGTVGNWNGSGSLLLGNDSDSTINSSSGEVGFSFNNAGRYALMVKPSVDTSGLISNYITSTQIAIFTSSASRAFTTHRTHSTNNITITTSGLASGSTLYYSIEGNSPYGTPGHFLNNLSGSFTTTGNTTILPLHSTASATSGTYNVKIRKFSTSGTIVASTGNISFGALSGTKTFTIAGPTQTYAALSNTFTANITTSSSSNQMSAQRLFYSIDSDANGTAYSNSSHFSTPLTGTIDITSLTSGNGSQTFAVTPTSSLPNNATYYVSLRKDNATDTGSNIVATSSQVTHDTNPLITYVNSTTYTGSGYMFLSGIQANDFVMVASVADSNGTGTITATNAGTITKDQSHSSSNPYHAVHYFRATGTSTEINVYSGNWIAFAFRYVNTTTPLDVTTTKDSSGSRPNPPAITTSTAQTMIVAFGFIDDQDGVSALTAPSGYTQAAYNYNSSYNASVMAIYKALPSAGTDDPGQFGGYTASVTAMTFALRRV